MRCFLGIFNLWQSVKFAVLYQCFSGDSAGKESAGNAGDADSVPGSGWFPGEGNSNPL